MPEGKIPGELTIHTGTATTCEGEACGGLAGATTRFYGRLGFCCFPAWQEPRRWEPQGSRIHSQLPRESGHAQILFFQAAAETGARLTGPAKRSGNFAVLLSLAFTFDLEDFGSFCDLLLPISAVDPVCLYVVDEQPHLDERAEPQLGMARQVNASVVRSPI